MNILVVCHYGLYHDLSFSYVHQQVREYVAMGHRVRVLIPNGMGKAGRDGKRIGKSAICSQVDGAQLCDLRYVTLSSYGEKWFNTASAIASIRLNWKRIMGDFAPDIIHAHTLGFTSQVGAWLKSRFHCPLVVTTHGSDTNVPLNNGQTDFLKACCDEADAVVAVSHQLRNRLASCGTTTLLRTIHNGFQVKDIPEGNVKKPGSMIQVCNLIPLKKVDVTIRAFAELKKRYPHMILTIVGQGPVRQMLEELCGELGISDAVEFTGQMPNDQVLARLRESEIFVMASKPEGFGIVYLEAMSSGCVTIGTEGEGISDLIVHGENGFLVPADDVDAIVNAVVHCQENAECVRNIVRRGICDSRELTWAANAQHNLDLFAELAADQ